MRVAYKIVTIWHNICSHWCKITTDKSLKGIFPIVGKIIPTSQEGRYDLFQRYFLLPELVKFNHVNELIPKLARSENWREISHEKIQHLHYSFPFSYFRPAFIDICHDCPSQNKSQWHCTAHLNQWDYAVIWKVRALSPPAWHLACHVSCDIGEQHRFSCAAKSSIPQRFRHAHGW